jgi:PAS domain-containing protein
MSEPVWQSAYVLALAASFALEIALLALVWRERDVRGAPGVAAAVACAAGWTGSALMLATAQPEQAAFWSASRRSFSALMPPICLLSTLSFMGRLRLRSTWVHAGLALLFVPHLARLYVLHGSGEALGMPFSVVAFERRGLLTQEIRVATSPLYWAFTVYSYAVMVGAALLFLRWASRSGLLAGGHARTLAMVFMLATLANVAERTGVTPRGLESTPIGMGIAVAIVAWAVLRRRLLDLVPVTRHALFDALDDGVLATDGTGRIVDLNPAMARILGTPAASAIGRAASDVLAPAGDLASRMAAGTAGTVVELGGRQYAVRTTRHAPDDLLLFVFRDMTEEIAAEREDQRRIAELRGAWLRMGTQRVASRGSDGQLARDREA